MKTKLISSFVVVLIFVALAFAHPAQAFEQQRTQYVTSLALQRPIAESDLGWRANIFDFVAPGTLDIKFFYVGLTFQKKLGNWFLWTSPQIVAVANFFQDHDSLGPALWVALSNRWVKLFLEPEAYFSGGGRKGYYGFYSLDLKLAPSIAVGTQLEQVYNEKMTYKFGPHVALSKAVNETVTATCSVTYFIDPDQKFQVWRLMFGAEF